MTGIYIRDDIAAERLVRECRESGGTRIDFTPLSLNRLPPGLAELTGLREINFDADHDKDGFPYHGHGALLEIPEYFGNFTRLETLNISSTCMVKFPGSLTRLASLKKLSLPFITHGKSPSLEIKNLSRFLRSWPNLEELHITGENIPALLECIDDLPNLRGLAIGCYGLRDTSPVLRLLEKLRGREKFIELGLDGPDNKIIRQAARLVQLQNLAITCKKLPESLGNLINLRELQTGGFDYDEARLPGSFANFTKLESLELAMPGLRELPPFIGSYTRLKKLSLKNTGIKVLPGCICDLESLEELSVARTQFRYGQNDEDNAVSALPENFGNLKSLKKLELHSTRIGTLPDSIRRLSALEELRLEDDELAELPPGLAALQSLKTLCITGKYQTMPGFIGDFPNLEELTFHGCLELKTVPETIGNLRSLKRLGFIFTGIETLPESIGRLANLEAFVKKESGLLKILPESIVNCGNLRLLRADGLDALPEDTGKLTNLKKLEAESGHIQTIPASTGNCGALEKLVIGSDRLAEIPESIGNLRALKEFELRVYNDDWEDDEDAPSRRPAPETLVSALPDSLGNLSNLHTLNIAACSLRRVPGSIGNLTNLESLRISAPVSAIPETIGNCRSLKELEISPDRDLAVLPDGIGRLDNLQSLEITDCALAGLPTIADLTALRVLRLMRVKLAALPDQTGNLRSLQSLTVRDTPLESLPGSIGRLINLEELDIVKTSVAVFPQSMDNLEKWSGLEISAENMTPLLESLAALKHLPHISVQNPKTRKLPAALKNHPEFYRDGDKNLPGISAEVWEGTGITLGGFVEPSLPGRVLQRIARFFRTRFRGSV